MLAKYIGKKDNRERLINQMSEVALSDFKANSKVNIRINKSLYTNLLSALSAPPSEAPIRKKVLEFLEARDLAAIAQIREGKMLLQQFLSEDKTKAPNMGQFAKHSQTDLNQSIESRTRTNREIPRSSISSQIACLCLLTGGSILLIGIIGSSFYGAYVMGELHTQAANSYQNILERANGIYFKMQNHCFSIFSVSDDGKNTCTLLPQNPDTFCSGISCESINPMLLNCAPFGSKDSWLETVPSWPHIDPHSDPQRALIPCATFIFNTMKECSSLFSEYEKTCNAATMDSTYSVAGFTLTLIGMCTLFMCYVMICSGACSNLDVRDDYEGRTRGIQSSREPITNAPAAGSSAFFKQINDERMTLVHDVTNSLEVVTAKDRNAVDEVISSSSSISHGMS